MFVENKNQISSLSWSTNLNQVLIEVFDILQQLLLINHFTQIY